MTITRRSLLGATLGATAIGGLALTGCSTTPSPASSGTPGAGKQYHIGVTQIVTHPSLDAARSGFKQALQDAGLTVTYDEQNAQGDQATAASIAAKFATANLDLVLAIATPTAQATAQAVTTTPILFTAVTDPVAAKLVASMDAPGGNVTGTTDMNPVADQIGLIKQIKPTAKTVGVVYSSGEVNSEVQVRLARTAAQADGLTLVEKTITATADLQQAVNSLGAVDAIYVPTDNNVVSGLSTVIQYAESKKIPVVVGEGDSVAKGGCITYGIDYNKLGYQTGQMAVQILTKGANPATMPVESQKDLQLYVNTAAAARMGVTIPADLLAKANKVGS